MARTARAMVAPGDGHRLELDVITIPDPGPGEAVVRVLACGLCHSDVGGLTRWYQPGVPVLLGHEAAVEVEAVGAGVSGLTPGDYGVVAWRAPCGSCLACRRGEPTNCLSSLRASQQMTTSTGVALSAFLGIGGFTEATLVAAAQVVPIDRAVRPEAAGLIGCGVMTGFGAAAYTGGVRRGDVVAVFGCGGVGDAAIAASSLAGAARIIAVDLNATKLEWARRFGATDVVNASEGDPLEVIGALTGGNGVDVAIEAVGIPSVYVQAFNACGPLGRLVQVGVPDRDAEVTLPLWSLFGRRGGIHVSHYGDCLPTRDFPALADLYLKGRLDLDAFVSETLPLEQLPEAIARLERGEVLRSVVVF